MTFWLVAAILIVVALAATAAWMLYLVHRQNRRNTAVQQQRDQVAAQQRARVNDSIQIIARSVQNDDLSLTEASIRICVLLDSLGVDDRVREEFSSFYQLYQATSHIPILDGWKQLSPREQHRFDVERAEHEIRYREFVLDSARRIIGREF